MDLLEYQSKKIFSNTGIPVPRGEVSENPEEASNVAEKLGEVVLKAQVRAGGRGKAGGVKFASSPEEAEKRAKELLNMKIKGLKVEKLLVEEKLNIKKELYAGITIDRTVGKAVFMVSSEGGIDIEDVARLSPERIFSKHIEPFVGLYPYAARELASKLGLEIDEFKSISDLFLNLYRVFEKTDAHLAEINPVVVAEEGIYAADAKLVIDDDALFRQDFDRSKDMPYVELSGNIGCIVNGAGLAMATMDTIKYLGGEPANFLDIGGGASSNTMKKALEKVSSHPKVRVIFVNILGGITRCDEVARGILEVSGIEKPLVVRLRGTRAEEGSAMLREKGYNVERDMIKAAKLAIGMAEERED
ncbi:MAG TPA: ADP-forming succinate--CoA ligase subunit beta [Euryarchaeota archaeon]|nr:succinyl-CoA ligase [ADP-forming] subunit beta [archaeon BMS3Bbin15]HDL15128.1 ADP-forming succinate--CoA ligase subunit beta [Euryarchaeota archaeon]